MEGIRTAMDRALIAVEQAKASMDTATKRISTGKKINAPADDPARWTASQQGRSIDGHLQAVNSGLESVAIGIRGADKAMAAIEEHIDQMIETVKLFPPYPEGDNSEERIKMLRSFNGIRQLIDQLTIPPQDDLGQAIMSDPATNPDVPDSWPVIVNEQGDVKTIGRQEVHTGLTGLNIPELTEADITENGVTGGPLSRPKLDDIAANLENAKAILRQRRDALGSDAAAIGRAKSSNEEAAAFHKAYAEKMEAADVNETAAQVTSIQLKQSLALESLGSITSLRSELVALLK
jgi:flagellin-like hook-associated protein FlgL